MAGDVVREKERRERAERIEAVDGIEPSARQREWAVEKPHGWLDEMAWAHGRGEIELTRAEISYAQARYGKDVATAVVHPVYRVARDARTEHRPDAGPELVAQALEAGFSRSELARRCGVSREFIRLLAGGRRDISFALQVLLEDLASTKPDTG